MQRYLFDTHALIWTMEDRGLTREAETAVNAAAANGQPIYVSPISAWERAMLIAKGRIQSPADPRIWFRQVLESEQIALADLSVDILTDAALLPPPVHGDPADRILIATARAYDCTLITHDRGILRYASTGHVRALAC